MSSRIIRILSGLEQYLKPGIEGAVKSRSEAMEISNRLRCYTAKVCFKFNVNIYIFRMKVKEKLRLAEPLSRET